MIEYAIGKGKYKLENSSFQDKVEKKIGIVSRMEGNGKCLHK